MKCAHGLCLYCEKDLMTTCPTCSHRKPGNNYTQIFFPLTNGSQMPVVVCLDHKDTIFNADKKEIMKAVRDGWHQEHDKMGWTKDKRDAYWETHGEGKLEIAD